MFHLTAEEERFLRKLDTPIRIQDYLDSLSFNFEEKGETCMSPRRVLQERKAHCIEGAFLAAAALLLSGKPALILNLKVDKRDDDHIVTLFKEHGYWGAISKTNHAVLRFRDPVYRSVRELAMTYFHEYFLVKGGEKTMKGFAGPINLRRFGTRWITSQEDLWDIAEVIYDSKIVSVVPKGNARFIREATKLEQKAASLPATA
jgi:hypothetical protein